MTSQLPLVIVSGQSQRIQSGDLIDPSALGTGSASSATYLRGDGTWSSPTGSGTVTSVSVTPANGVSGTVATATSTPAITLTLGDITPSSIDTAGQITSTVTTGTPPLVISSTTNIPNLNASSLNGATFAAPGSIGSGTASDGTFTTLTTTNALTVDTNTVISNVTYITTTTSPTVIAIVPTSTYRSAEFLIQGVDITSPKYHTVKMLAIHNGATANSVEYGGTDLGGQTATFTVSVSGGNLQLIATPTTTNSTTFKITIIATTI